jgi:hypothetical protein
MRSRTVLFVTICCLFATTLWVLNVRGAEPESIAIYDCEGNACQSVTFTWDNDRQQFKVQNDSGQIVKVEVTTFAGVSSVRVEPHKEDYLAIKTFNGPYRANYD